MGVVTIPLGSSGKVAFVSECDFLLVSGYTWALTRGAGNHFYAAAGIRGQRILMHRLLTGAEKGMCVDHIDGNGLNNTRENIRVCTYSQNMQNRPMQRNNKLGIKGVYQDKRSSLFVAKIRVNGERKILGWFRDPQEAGNAYLAAAKELHGEFAHKSC